MEIEQTIQRLEASIDALTRRAAGREESFREGFLNGIWCSLLLLQGRNPRIPVAQDPAAVRKKTPSAPPHSKAAQRKLF